MKIMFPGARSTDEEFLLSQVRSNISPSEWIDFSGEGGFIDPVNFNFSEMTRVLQEKTFPRSEVQDFGWAIYECGTSRIEAYPPWVKYFACMVYLYSQKYTSWGANYQAFFFYELISLSVVEENAPTSEISLMFLEWLYEFVAPDGSYENYFLLLAWLIVRWKIGRVSDVEFKSVLDTLKNKAFNSDELSLMNDFPSIGPMDWYELIRNLQEYDSISIDSILSIIFGVDSGQKIRQ